MSDVKWIKITTNIFDDEKIKLIDALPERDTIIVLWFKLLAMAGKTNDNGLVYIMKEMATTDEVLSTIFNRPINTVRLALNTFENFGMIEINEHVNIVNWEKHQNIEGLEKIRVQNKERAKKYRKRLSLVGGYDYQKSYEKLVKRDGESCIYCGSKESLCIDHITPVLAGGTNDINNLGISCKRCNSGKGGRTPKQAGYEIISVTAKKAYHEYVTHGHATEVDKEVDLEKEKETKLLSEFEKFWNLYDKKVDRKATFKKWQKLKQEDKDKIFQTLPDYVKSTPDVKFRKNPTTYLNNESWNDEIVCPCNTTKETSKSNSLFDCL